MNLLLLAVLADPVVVIAEKLRDAVSPDSVVLYADSLETYSSRLAPWTAWYRGGAYIKAGNYKAAKAELAGTYSRAGNSWAVRQLWNSLAGKLKGSSRLSLCKGYPELAGASGYGLWLWASALSGKARKDKLQELVRRYPKSSYALKAMKEVSPPAHRAAAVWYNARKYDEVLELAGAKPGGALLLYGVLANYKLGKYRTAATMFQNGDKAGLSGDSRAKLRFYVAVCYDKLGLRDSAVSLLISLADGPYGEKAVFELGLEVMMNLSEPGWADSAYRRIAAALENCKVEGAPVRLGLIAIALGRKKDAELHLLKAADSDDRFVRSQALFWLYRVTGKWTYRSLLARHDPLGYYNLTLSGNIPLSRMRADDWSAVESDTMGGGLKERYNAFKALLVLGHPLSARTQAAGEARLYWPAAKFAIGQGDFLAASMLLTWLYRAAPRKFPMPNEVLDAMYPRHFPDEVTFAADSAGIPAALLLAVVREESRFDPAAHSPAGANGLAQLMPKTARVVADSLGMSSYDVWEPSDNLLLGAHHLAQHYDRYGKLHLALAAYNAGSGAVDRWLYDWGFKALPDELFVEFISYEETRNYVRRVLKSYYVYLQFLDTVTGRPRQQSVARSGRPLSPGCH